MSGFDYKKTRNKRTKGNTRNPKTVIQIFCEGQTEYEYLEFLRVKHRVSNMNLKLIKLKKQGSCETLANEAIRLKKESNHNYDQYAIVLDRDFDVEESEFKKVTESLSNKGIETYESYPAIEFWFLLHFQNYGDTDLTNQILIEKLNHHLKDYSITYNKSKDIIKKISEIINPKQNQAIQNAKKILKSPTQKAYTKLHILIEKILDEK